MMMNVIDFLNNNALFTSLIVLFISTMINIIFRKSDRKYDLKMNLKKEIANKARLHIVDNNCNLKEKPDIRLFITDYKEEDNKKKQRKIIYDKNILDKSKYIYKRFYLKNIGKTNIEQLDICLTDKYRRTLCNLNSVEYIVNNCLTDCSYNYDRTIFEDDIILIELAFPEKSKIFNIYSCELVLLFEDSYGNKYKQPFFIGENKEYEPKLISEKKYSFYTEIN